jgi:hypothetical protein
VSGNVEAYAYDKCDYIEYEIQGVQQKIAAVESDLGDLTPQQRAGAFKQLAGLGAQILAFEKGLKICRQ